MLKIDIVLQRLEIKLKSKTSATYCAKPSKTAFKFLFISAFVPYSGCFEAYFIVFILIRSICKYKVDESVHVAVQM